jgi:ferric-dicitrate binding protein FerR (iron transport regulator)
MNPSDHAWIQQVLDGATGADGFPSFQQRLRQDPGFAALYRDYALLHHSLYEEFEGRQMIGRTLPAAGARRRSHAPLVAAAAAIALAAGLGWWLLAPSNPTTAPAGIAFSAGARWQLAEGTAADPNTTTLDTGSRVTLEQGSARLTLPAGSTGVISAPATFSYVLTDTLRLESGRGRFRHPPGNGRLVVETPSFTAIDVGTEFAVVAQTGVDDELHVFDGRVELRRSGFSQGPILRAGEAAAVPDHGPLVRMTARPAEFPTGLTAVRVLVADHFDAPGAPHSPTDHRPTGGPAAWEVRAGNPTIGEGVLHGTDFEVFLTLAADAMDEQHPVLLATLETVNPPAGEFHAPGWSGMSLFQQDAELVFFGDSFGSDRTWSLDIKQGVPPILPETPVTGPRTVTLRYHWLTGETTLHDGPDATRPAFVRAALPARLNFDQLRLAASPDASLAVRSLSVRATAAPGAE